MSNALDENLQIVHTAERILLALEHTELRHCAAPGRFERQFQRVTQLFQRDAHAVQPLGQIDGAGITHGRVEPLGSPRHARIDHPAPLLRSPRRFDVLARVEILGSRLETLRETTHLAHRQIVGEPLPGFVARLGNRHCEPTQRVAVLPARLMQLVYQQEEHIELAHAAEVLGHLSQTPAELSRRRVFQLKDGHQLPKTAGRHARGMKHPDIAAFETTKGSVEALQMAAQEFRSGDDDGHGEKRHYIVRPCA
ncbi:MAG TPA: hypothetical protein VIW45_03505 [Vicinamibacterales bacterium]